MPDVSVRDLDDLMQFRDHLVSFNHTLKEEFSRMRSHWNSVREIWNDEKARQFEQELDELWPGIKRYLENTDGHEHYLRQLIDLLQRVRETRI